MNRQTSWSLTGKKWKKGKKEGTAPSRLHRRPLRHIEHLGAAAAFLCLLEGNAYYFQAQAVHGIQAHATS